MPRAFSASSDIAPATFTQEDMDAVLKHCSVAYILSPPIHENAAQISGDCLSLVERLFTSGEALAIKSDSAGITHGKTRWLRLAKVYHRAKSKNLSDEISMCLYQAWVQKGLIDNNRKEYYSTGMHLLGCPDISIELSSKAPTEEELISCFDWQNEFGCFLACQSNTDFIQDGDLFKLGDRAECRSISLEKCYRYRPDNYYFNPFGVYRMQGVRPAQKLGGFGIFKKAKIHRFSFGDH